MSGSIRHTGTGSASSAPDVVVARIGVQIRADSVSAAFDAASASARGVVAAVVATGVAHADIATTDVGLQPVETGPWEDRRLEGYSATESLVVTIRDLGRAARVLQAATTAAGDAVRIESVSFAVINGDAALVQARERAFADARAGAEHYARLAGLTLGAVRSIVDEPVSGRPMPEVRFTAQRAADSGPAMQPGERSVNAKVTVEWDLD